MRPGNFIVVLGCVVAASVLLGSCRENEQDRVLVYQKGSYLGKPDTAVSESALRALSAQIQRQNERAGPSGGGGPAGRPPAEVTLSPAPLPVDLLRQRARRQD